MSYVFYISAAVALLSTLRVITNSNPMHALLYLVISLLSIAMIFFSTGAPFAGALEIIVYASAIMVLFVFTVMMLNLGDSVVEQERVWLRPGVWIGPAVLAGVLLAELLTAISQGQITALAGTGTIGAKTVGIALFGPYLLVVELASVLLLAALAAAYHLGRLDEKD